MKMEISILYHVIVNSQSNRDNLTRCYIKKLSDVASVGSTVTPKYTTFHYLKRYKRFEDGFDLQEVSKRRYKAKRQC